MGTQAGFFGPVFPVETDKGTERNTFGMALPEEIKSAMSEIEITEELLQKGELLMNLPLPDNTLVAMIKRNNNYMVPKGKTRLCPGDKLLVISEYSCLERSETGW